ncbi:hypothetical protein SLA2020_468810 [Shorea laevis]
MQKNKLYENSHRTEFRRKGARIAGHGGLPEDIVFDILALLPVESLIRFKCVRQSWRDLISSPRFAVKHLRNPNRSSSDDRLLLMRLFGKKPGELENRLSLFSFADDNRDTSTVVKSLDFSISSGPRELEISGYCDGIICLSDSRGFIALANPGLRQFRVLPVTFPSSEPIIPFNACCSGFGYDPISDDYKVVRIWNSYYSHIPRVEIYTLSTDSWREIKSEPFLEEISLNLIPGKYLNGAYYWWTEDDELVFDDEDDQDEDVEFQTRDVMIVFDMSKEVFLRIPFPELLRSVARLRKIPLILNESLALVSYTGTGSPEKLFDTRVINEVGDDKSRSQVTKLSKIGPLCGVRRPLLFWKNDQVLFESWNNVSIVSYKKDTNETKDLPLVLCHDFRLPEEVTAEVYTSSLISVARGS